MVVDFNFLRLFEISVLPTQGPNITGGEPKYRPGDIVKVNCTSAPSKPPAHLMWYVNGKAVSYEFAFLFELCFRENQLLICVIEKKKNKNMFVLIDFEI